MRDLFVTLVVFGSIPLILKRPHIGILMWCWISYMNPHRMAWGFAYSMPFAAMIAATTLLSTVISNDSKRLPITPVTVTLILFVLWMTFTTMFAISPDDAATALKKVYKIQFMTFLTLILMAQKERINQLVWVIVLSLGFFGIKGGLFTIATGGSFRVWGPPDSFVEGNNELALALLMVIPLLNYLRLTVENVWIKRGLLGSIGLLAIAAIGSQSRGALLAFLAMLGYLWLKSGNKLITGIFGIIFTALLFSFMPDSWHQRMNTIETYEEDGSAMGRINAWTVAINIAKDRLTAGGFEHWSPKTFALYAPNPLDVHDAHSIYFEVLGEHGFIGLILFLLIGIFAFRDANWTIKKTEGRKELKWANLLSRNLYVSLIAYAIGGAFLGLAYYDLYYHLVAILVLTRQIVARELASPSTTENSEIENDPPRPGRIRKHRSFVRPVKENR